MGVMCGWWQGWSSLTQTEADWLDSGAGWGCTPVCTWSSEWTQVKPAISTEGERDLLHGNMEHQRRVSLSTNFYTKLVFQHHLLPCLEVPRKNACILAFKMFNGIVWYSLSLFIIELCILLCRIVLYVLCLYIYHCIEFCGVIIVF